MAVIIRRSAAPTVIKRRRGPAIEDRHGSTRRGQFWPGEPGWPDNRVKRAYHAIDIDGRIYAFLWEPSSPLGPAWSCGKWSCSPSVMSIHDYRGECAIVFRSPSTPSDFTPQPRSKWRK
jgi:hypothetical protein